MGEFSTILFYSLYRFFVKKTDETYTLYLVVKKIQTW